MDIHLAVILYSQLAFQLVKLILLVVVEVSVPYQQQMLFLLALQLSKPCSVFKPRINCKHFCKIESVSLNSLTISAVTTVTDVADGALPTSDINPSDFRILTTSLQSSTDNTLYTITKTIYC